MRCVPTWRSSASSRHKATMASRHCSPSSPTPVMPAYPRMRGPACQRLSHRSPPPGPRSPPSTSGFSSSIVKASDRKRLETIPGIGVPGASAIVATVPDVAVFQTGTSLRRLDRASSRAWHSTGGKQRLGPISKQGDRYLRRLLVRWRICCLERGARPSRKVPLAHRTVSAQAGEGCCSRNCSQDGAHRLGGVDQQRDLPCITDHCDTCLKERV